MKKKIIDKIVILREKAAWNNRLRLPNLRIENQLHNLATKFSCEYNEAEIIIKQTL